MSWVEGFGDLAAVVGLLDDREALVFAEDAFHLQVDVACVDDEGAPIRSHQLVFAPRRLDAQGAGGVGALADPLAEPLAVREHLGERFRNQLRAIA